MFPVTAPGLAAIIRLVLWECLQLPFILNAQPSVSHRMLGPTQGKGRRGAHKSSEFFVGLHAAFQLNPTHTPVGSCAVRSARTLTASEM